MPREAQPLSDLRNLCASCGADWTWFRWEDDDEPPCECDLGPVETDEEQDGR